MKLHEPQNPIECLKQFLHLICQLCREALPFVVILFVVLSLLSISFSNFNRLFTPLVSRFHRQAIELTERTTPEQAAAIREPLNAVNRRWENLLRGMVDRQKQLEHALLHLGQFQHALNELLVWINKTDNTLDQLKPVSPRMVLWPHRSD